MKISELVDKLSFKNILILLLVIFSAWTYFSMKKYENQVSRTLLVYNDSISTYKNKLDQEFNSKNLYIQELSDVKVNNKELYDEIKNLREHPLIVTKTVVEYRKDTTELNNDIEKVDSTYHNINWSLRESYNEKNFFDISGYSRVKNDFSKSNTYLNSLRIGASLSLDIIESKDKTYFQILTRSDNPNLEFTDIQGAFINPNNSKVIKNLMKQRNFGIGLYGGYGLNAIPNDKVSAGFQIGIGVVWSPSFLRF